MYTVTVKQILKFVVFFVDGTFERNLLTFATLSRPDRSIVVDSYCKYSNKYQIKLNLPTKYI